MVEKIGVIKSAKFGIGGYQDCQIVFEFNVGGDSWGTFCTFECGWANVSEEELNKPNSHYKWTHEFRINNIGKNAYKIIQIMKDAKVDSLDKLIGKPVRVFFESECGRNQGFEILKDAIL